MSYAGARSTLVSAKSNATDESIRHIADGLSQLSRAIEDDMRKLERELGDVKRKIDSLH